MGKLRLRRICPLAGSGLGVVLESLECAVVELILGGINGKCEPLLRMPQRGIATGLERVGPTGFEPATS